MLNFNNDHIFTGYLKQLLASFNLPKYRVYTKEQEKYFKANGEELNIISTIKTIDEKYPEDLRYTAYIKDDKIQHYIKEEQPNGVSKYYWQPTKLHYHENKKEINYTKQFQIKNNLYDTYTHEYLGDFLRFIRDYYDVNLMPLYNCFSNKICSNLDLSFKLINSSKVIQFLSSDNNYKIYMLPVKLFKNYTIAIDSNLPIELCCGLFGAYLDTRDISTKLSKMTYKKISGSCFNRPFIYDKLTNKDLIIDEFYLSNIAQNEDNLKLFIKVPINNKSSITVLEGDYLGYNDSYYDPNTNIVVQNKLITNFYEGVSEDPKYKYEQLVNRDFKPISQLQLLMMNTGVSYPFAERLIEYLSENAITSLETISDNIKRAQLVLSSAQYTKTTKKYIPNIYGLWDKKLNIYLYDAVVNNHRLNYKYNLKHDLLGYVDKDTENLVTRKYVLTYKNKNDSAYQKSTSYESISKIDLYENLYNNTYLTDSSKFKDWEDIE